MSKILGKFINKIPFYQVVIEQMSYDKWNKLI